MMHHDCPFHPPPVPPAQSSMHVCTCCWSSARISPVGLFLSTVGLSLGVLVPAIVPTPSTVPAVVVLPIAHKALS